MQDKSCVVSVAFRSPYIEHSLRQQQTIAESDPLLHYFAYRDVLPAKGTIHTEDIVTRFQESLYGFKPHAIQTMIDQGYEKIIWLDPSVLPTVPIQVLIDALDIHPVITRAGENEVSEMTSQRVKDWFNVWDSQLKSNRVKHVAGTVYGFNFKHPKAVEVFELWKSAEENGMFGNQDEFMAGSWADESAMSLCLYKCNVPQYWCEGFQYLNQKEMQ